MSIVASLAQLHAKVSAAGLMHVPVFASFCFLEADKAAITNQQPMQCMPMNQQPMQCLG